MPPALGVHDKKKATIFALLRQSFAVIWPLKWFKATFETFVLFFFRQSINLLNKIQLTN